MPKDMPFVAIVGAGPAGLIAADLLAAAGARVELFDRMASPARKFLMAGRGGLNLTHSEAESRFLARYGEAERVKTAVRAFPPAALIAYAEGLGESCFTGSSGRVFPKSFKASPFLRALLRRLEAKGVRIHPRHKWTGWTSEGALRFDTPDGERIVAPQASLLALGGASWPKLGSDGGWTTLLGAKGVNITPLVPSNCGLLFDWSEHMSRFAGQPLKAVALDVNGQRFRGEAMISSKGLEGGLVYAAGAALRRSDLSFTLDLCPDRDAGALAEALSRQRGKASLSTRLAKAARLSPQAIALAREAGPLPAEPKALAERLKHLPLRAKGLAGLERAISTAGGVALSELNEDFSVLAEPTLFIAGEMLDFDAPTGGYLLQAAFATGVVAASGIATRLGLAAPPGWSGAFEAFTAGR